jgi:hypothetical protein
MFPQIYFTSCSKRASIFKRSHYGCKIKIAQLRYEHRYKDYDKILLRLHEKGWKFIHLVRTNFLRHKLSNFIAAETNIFHIRNGESMPPVRIKVNCEALLEGIVYGEEVFKTELENLNNIPHIRIEYERDILDNSKHQETADRIFKFLGLETHIVATDYKRLTVDSLEDMISNYDEVYNFFKDTKYSKYLN